MEPCPTPNAPIPHAAIAFAALQAVEAPAVRADPAEVLALVRGLVAGRERRRLSRRRYVPAGAATEILHATGGAPTVVPAPGSLPGIDEGHAGISVYRTVAAGRVADRHVAFGSRVLVSRRAPERGEWLLVATRGSLRLAVADSARRPEGWETARIVGVVEGVVSSQ